MPTPTPTFNEIAKAFPEKGLTEETWENMSPIMRGIFLKNYADFLLSSANVTPTPTPTKPAPKTGTPTPSTTKTATPTPTTTPTGGFAYLMNPETQKVKRVPWAEVADLIKAGWQEVDS